MKSALINSLFEIVAIDHLLLQVCLPIFYLVLWRNVKFAFFLEVVGIGSLGLFTEFFVLFMP
jgi:hypothetical protein